MSTRQPSITIRCVSSHYLTQLTPGTQNTTHQITARHNKKAIGQYKPMNCITHGSSKITPCHCIVYFLLWSALYQQYILQYHTADTTIIFLLIRHSASITDQSRTIANRSGSHSRPTQPEPNTGNHNAKKEAVCFNRLFIILYLICN